MSRSAIATTRKKPPSPAEEEGPTGAEWLLEVDPSLAALFDQLDERLRAAQDEEHARHTPIDWEDVQQDLAAEQARLLVAGADAIDAIMNISDLGVSVARHAAGIETAYHMANLHRTVQRALPAPSLGGGNGGDGDPEAPDPGDVVYGDAYDTDTVGLSDWVESLHTDPEGLPVGEDGLPLGTPPWDDPEGAHTTSYRIVGTVVEADTFPTGRKPHRWGRGWWAGVTAICALPLIAAAALVVTVVRWGW